MKKQIEVPVSLTEQVLEFACKLIIIYLFSIIVVLTFLKAGGIDYPQEPQHIPDASKTESNQ